jgi:hypothetical protein
MEMTLPPMATAEVADVVRLPHQHGPPEPAEDLGVDEGGAAIAPHPALLYIEQIPTDGSRCQPSPRRTWMSRAWLRTASAVSAACDRRNQRHFQRA